ncbi:MAG: tRNA 2-thiocytidine(32) synthetase TtcA [Clostridiales bacterium]|jgi:tRNA 2-thiocytidine biosynthesis protein TtcA|nr:tRNA 2-thiocytidine(32) synthetase TtcA [Clostridiales bacterium]
MKKILGCLRRAVEDFNMIEEGDRIAVGVSGGKDSLILLKALRLYQYMSPVKYELEAITLDMGYEGTDWTEVGDYCRELDIPYTLKETNIAKIVFDVRQEKNPCSLCANLRRGALNNTALELNCKKVALGHHREDVIETLFLSMFYEGRFNTFSPVTYLDRKDINLIRPMVYVPEADIKKAVSRHDIPVVFNPCPANGYTKREYIKNLLHDISGDIPNVHEQILSALKKSKVRKLWDI